MSNLESALAYARLRTWSVFPLVPKSKKPLTANGFKDATRDEEQIKEWWTRWPNANIGIPTGFENGFFALDVDVKNNGQDTLFNLITENGVLPHTIQAKTGGGGSHFLFKYEEGIKNRIEFQKGLDIKGQDGYLVVSPSIHDKTGNRYEWINHPLETHIAEAPRWLIEMIKEPNRVEHQAKPKSHWNSIIQGVGEGARNESATSLSGLLVRRFFDNLELAWELLMAWNDRNNPPIEEEELLRTFRSVLNREIQRRKGA